MIVKDIYSTINWKSKEKEKDINMAKEKNKVIKEFKLMNGMKKDCFISNFGKARRDYFDKSNVLNNELNSKI